MQVSIFMVKTYNRTFNFANGGSTYNQGNTSAYISRFRVFFGPVSNFLLKG